MTMILNDGRIGENIKRLRKAAGYSQEQLAAKLDLAGSRLGRTGISKIERGIGNVKESDLRILKNLLNVDFNAFFKD